MPPTNDVNEGALGAFRLLMRRQPQLSLLQYNAQAMFRQNETQAFMEKKFLPEDYKFIRKTARDADAKHLEKERKQMRVEHNDEKIWQRAQRSEARKAKATKKLERIAAITLIFDKKKIAALKGDNLRDHLEAFRLAEAPGLESVKQGDKVGKIREALQAAIDSFTNNVWVPVKYSGAENSSEDESLEGDSSWEDEDD
jgi:hypothetical protein